MTDPAQNPGSGSGSPAPRLPGCTGHRSPFTFAIVLTTVCALATTVRADTVIPSVGSATVAAGDTAAARTKALDDAFRQAVDQSVAALVEPKTREAQSEVIKKRVLRRARSFVVKFKVLEEGDHDGVYTAKIEATVADAQILTELRASGVLPDPAAQQPRVPTQPEEPAGPTPPPIKRPALALLAVTSDGANVWSTFGRGAADIGPAAPILQHELEARGFHVVVAQGIDVPVAPGGTVTGPPLDAAQAAAVARQVGVGGAVVAGIKIKDGGPIRGTRQVGSEVEISLRIDDVAGGALVVDDCVADAGFGADGPAAHAAAIHAASERAGRAIGKRLEAHWPEETAASPAHGGGLLVRIRGVARWLDVDPFVRAFAAMPGVKQVTTQRFSAREVTLAVRGAAATRALIDVAAGLSLPDAKLGVRQGGAGEVIIDIAGDMSRPVTPVPPVGGHG